MLIRSLVSLGLTMTISAASAQADDKVRISVRSFIPSSYPSSEGELIALPGTQSKMILLDFEKVPGFGTALGLIGQPLKHCFATDNRSFSDKPDASTRVTAEFVLVAGASPRVETAADKRFRAGTTRKYDCNTGKELAAKNADLSACVLGTPAHADGKVQIVMGCKASDPLVPLIPNMWAPDLHFNGSFTYSIKDKTLAFNGDVGAFPSYEAYASLNGGAFKFLFKVSPAKGANGQSLIDLWQHINVKKLAVAPVKL